MKVVVIQLGARENYAWAVQAYKKEELLALITDSWLFAVPNFLRFVLSKFAPALLERKHEFLREAPVYSFTFSLLLKEFIWKLNGYMGWELYERRNLWFQKRVVRLLKRMKLPTNTKVLCYSYAARQIFETTPQCEHILLQIDGGFAEEELVSKVAVEAGEPHISPSVEYWDSWEKEVQKANKIVVNSKWSDTLLKSYFPWTNSKVIPLSLSGNESLAQEVKLPLEVLYLGTATPRKGFHILLEVAKKLINSPIHFTFVGNGTDKFKGDMELGHNCTFIGKIAQSNTVTLYQRHAVFILPTFSDGFALTQLEAAFEGCYLMVSHNCADVLQHYGYGEYLDALNADKIVEQLKILIEKIDADDINKKVNSAWSHHYTAEKVFQKFDTWKD